MAGLQPQPYYAIRTRRPAEGSSTSSFDSTVCVSLPLLQSLPRAPDIKMRPEEVSASYSPCLPLQYGSGIDCAPPATHDTSRVSYHVKQLDSFAQTLQEVGSISPCGSFVGE